SGNTLSVTTLIPPATVSKVINCACTSVGIPGYGNAIQSAAANPPSAETTTDVPRQAAPTRRLSPLSNRKSQLANRKSDTAGDDRDSPAVTFTPTSRSFSTTAVR